jgi:hypothetical protein
MIHRPSIGRSNKHSTKLATVHLQTCAKFRWTKIADLWSKSLKIFLEQLLYTYSYNTFSVQYERKPANSPISNKVFVSEMFNHCINRCKYCIRNTIRSKRLEVYITTTLPFHALYETPLLSQFCKTYKKTSDISQPVYTYMIKNRWTNEHIRRRQRELIVVNFTRTRTFHNFLTQYTA